MGKVEPSTVLCSSLATSRFTVGRVLLLAAVSGRVEIRLSEAVQVGIPWAFFSTARVVVVSRFGL